MLLGHSQKKQRLEQALPVITGLLQSRLHPSQARRIQILLDSGALQSIVHKNYKSTTWNTVAGTFQTMVKTTVTFKFPTLHAQ
jgi:hypothetical protein